MFKKVRGLVVAVGTIAGLLGASSAMASITLPTSLDITPFETMAGLVIGVQATVWAFYKGYSLLKGR